MKKIDFPKKMTSLSAANLERELLKNGSKQLLRFLWFLGKHAFWVIMVFIFLDVLAAGWVFYQDAFLPESMPVDGTALSARFDQAAYQDVVHRWQLRNSAFSDNSPYSYTDPFQ